jgi:hypothetical protein
MKGNVIEKRGEAIGNIYELLHWTLRLRHYQDLMMRIGHLILNTAHVKALFARKFH